MTIENFLSRLEGVTGHNGQYKAKCPAHDDKKASLSIGKGRDNRIVMRCHAGCNTVDVLASMGLTKADLFDNSQRQDIKANKPRVVATYRYISTEGVHYEKQRFSDKSFRWRQPDGKGGWRYDRQGIIPTLYGTGSAPLPDHVYFVEGEKDADNLRACSAAAVSPPDGSGSKWQTQYTEALRGKHVVILPDNDKPGRELANRAAEELTGKAASVKVLDLIKEWPNLPEKGDISDLLAAEPSEDVFMKLESLEASTPEWEPSQGEGGHVLRTISARELRNKKLPPPRYVVVELLPQGLSLLASPPKYGKSWFVLDLCLSVAAGTQFLGCRTIKSGCLYLALEDSERRLQERTNKILGDKDAPEGFDYATSALAVGEGLIEQLEGYMKSKPETGLIVIDTLQKVRISANGKENAYSADYKEMGILKSFADRHGVCLVLVHHLRKMGDDGDPFNRISGTNGILGAVDSAFVMTRAKRTDTQTTLSITGRDIEARELVIEFNREDSRWHVMGDAEQIAEQRARQEYENSPIIVTVKKLLEQSPGGWTGTMQDLMEAGTYFAGTYLAATPRDLSAKLKSLDGLMFDYDHIIHARGKNGSGGGRHRLFYRTVDTIARENVHQTKLPTTN